MTPATHLPNDSESLQADVMRFMAIIAFCLIAILALVRNVEPADVAQAETEPVGAPEPTAAPEPIIEPEPTPEPLALAAVEPEPTPAVVEPEPIDAALESLPVWAAPEPIVEPLPVAPVPSPAEEVSTAIAEEVSTAIAEEVSRGIAEEVSPAIAEEVPAIDPPDAPPVHTEEEEGLILRFASDKDFLRLIARGDITVYAYQDSDVLSLDGSYRFLESRAPGQVYELLTASIPGLILDALKQERTDIRAYRWGVALPRRISSQIERHLEQVESGQLVIDRYGDVHHVAAS